MLIVTKGIVLNTIKYNDNKFIIKIYTESFGLKSYITFKSKKQNYFKLFNHLSIVNIVATNNNKNDIQTLKEINLAYIPTTIPFDIRKSALIIFIKELILNCIKEQEPNQKMFEFLNKTIINLDNTSKGLSSYHIYFMINFSYYLGFKPNNNYSENNKYFNLAEGLFTNKIPENNNYMNSSLSLIFHKILNNIENNCYPTINILLNPLTRNELLTTLIQYYKMHLPNIEQLNSHKILQEVLSS